MGKIYSLLIGLLLTGSVFAQKNADIHFVESGPEIDGFIEEIWDVSAPVIIENNFSSEMPTITATWQVLEDDDNLYVCLIVEDDNHWPGCESGGNNPDYDMPVIYLDVDEELKDGLGIGTNHSGHYKFAVGFEDGMYDTPITESPSFDGFQNPGGTYAYSLVGEGYVFEIAIPWANIPDKNGDVIIPYASCHRIMGFDVIITDQDEGITTSPQRKGWSDIWNITDAGTNIDEIGQINFPCYDYDYWGPFLNLSSNSITLSSKAGSTDSVNVKPDYSFDWTAISDKSWLTVNPTSHKGDGILTVTASENTGAARTATVTFDWVGNRGAVLIVTQEAGGVGFTSRKIQNVKFSPNPASDLVSIQGGGIDRIELINSLGIKVRDTKIKGITFSVGDLPNGVYILKAFNKEDFAGVAKIFKN
jgi:hypothetical protein